MKIIVRGNKLDQLDCDDSYTIFEIKKSIAKSLNINDLSQINLYFNGVPMQNSEHIENYDLYENAAIDLNFGLAGGKTHGRIGLAGKVRNQTPKVDKKEKTKELTGRAKKRRQYNQRFLNVAIKE